MSESKKKVKQHRHRLASIHGDFLTNSVSSGITTMLHGYVADGQGGICLSYTIIAHMLKCVCKMCTSHITYT